MVVGVSRMVVNDDAGDVFRHLGLIALGGGNLESRAAACGQLHAVKGKLKSLAIVRHRLVQYVSVCKCSETLVHCDLSILLI